MEPTIKEKQTQAEAIIHALNKTSVFLEEDSARLSAIIAFENAGLPNFRNEEYKYCNIEGFLKKEFKKFGLALEDLTPEKVKPFFLKDAHNVVIANGRYNKDLSDKSFPRGLTVDTLKGNFKSDFFNLKFTSGLTQLNKAFVRDGLYLNIAKNAIIEKPIHIIHINDYSQEGITNYALHFIANDGSNATINEQFINLNPAFKVFSNITNKVELGLNAHIQNNLLQAVNEGDAIHYEKEASIKKDSEVTVNTISLDGALIRNTLTLLLADSHNQAHLNGLFVANKHQLIDNHTSVVHAFPNCESFELYKGIIADKATAVFNGKIFVERDAQKTNAYQSSKNILMSDDATINTKPQLEIYADDVKCSHGTSTGKIDEEAVFYLNARGIGKDAAKKLLLQAFANDVIEKIKDSSFKTLIEDKVNNKLQAL